VPTNRRQDLPTTLEQVRPLLSYSLTCVSKYGNKQCRLLAVRFPLGELSGRMLSSVLERDSFLPPYKLNQMYS